MPSIFGNSFAIQVSPNSFAFTEQLSTIVRTAVDCIHYNEWRTTLHNCNLIIRSKVDLLQACTLT